MSIATHALRYGWVYLASLTIGTGTIFMVEPALNRITLKDRIEVTLGLVERCMATQTGTNSDGTPIYAVAPPSIVGTWTDANGASVIMTNAFEWRDDLSVKTNLDFKIKALIPYYVDTNTVYDGTTNIIMLTVTGLWARLQIGDYGMHVTTNTNTLVVSTNWGTSFTEIPAIGTNAATYGPWAWRNYVVAWQERYKVLNALVARSEAVGWSLDRRTDGANFSSNSWSNMKGIMETRWPDEGPHWNAGPPYNAVYTAAVKITPSGGWQWWMWGTDVMSSYMVFNFYCPTSFSATIDLWTLTVPVLPDLGETIFEANGYPVGAPGIWYKSVSSLLSNPTDSATVFEMGNTNYPFPVWIDEPPLDGGWRVKGFQLSEARWIKFFIFNYCTNKYW